MTSKKSCNQDDDRYETEEYMVYVDLDTKLLDDQLSKSKTKIKFLGIDTENPIMQLNNQLFKGSYEYSMGTHCFFTESKRPGGVEDACFQELPKKLYDYFGKTNKVLKMKRIFVEEKETTASTELAEGEIEDLEHLRISKTYGDALNQFLKPGEHPPREIVQDSQESDEDEEAGMEPDQISESVAYEASEELPEEPVEPVEPSEDSETARVIKQLMIEADAQVQMEHMTDLNDKPQ